MSGEPVFGMLVAVACRTQIRFYLRFMFNIWVALITGYLVIGDMVLVHESKVIVFIHSFLDIMARITLILRHYVTCAN